MKNTGLQSPVLQVTSITLKNRTRKYKIQCNTRISYFPAEVSPSPLRFVNHRFTGTTGRLKHSRYDPTCISISSGSNSLIACLHCDLVYKQLFLFTHFLSDVLNVDPTKKRLSQLENKIPWCKLPADYSLTLRTMEKSKFDFRKNQYPSLCSAFAFASISCCGIGNTS